VSTAPLFKATAVMRSVALFIYCALAIIVFLHRKARLLLWARSGEMKEKICIALGSTTKPPQHQEHCRLTRLYNSYKPSQYSAHSVAGMPTLQHKETRTTVAGDLETSADQDIDL
jgi:hypothetical protein